MTEPNHYFAAIRKRPDLYARTSMPLYHSVLVGAVNQLSLFDAKVIEIRYGDSHAFLASDLDWLSGADIGKTFEFPDTDRRLPPNSFRFEVLLGAFEFDFWTDGKAGTYGDASLSGMFDEFCRATGRSWGRGLVMSKVSGFEKSTQSG